MATHFLPLSSTDSVFTVSASLDGEDFVIRLRWNARVRRWFFRLEDVEGNVLIGDQKMVADIPNLYHRRLDGLPPGELWTVTISAQDPGLTSFASDASFLYVDEESLA